MRGNILLLLYSLCLVSVANADSKHTRHLYTVRSPNVDRRRRRAVEIIDLGTFLLTNSEDGRPKPMLPFYLTIAETRGDLSETAIQNVEDATSEFLLAELNNNVFEWDSVANVQTEIVTQERVVEEIADRTLRLSKSEHDNAKFVRGRRLRSVPGSQFEVNVNVTFDREPSPDAAEVDQSLQRIMQDLSYLVDNITATEDPELGYVFMAYREEIADANQNPTTVVDIQKGVEERHSGRQSMKFIIPFIVGLVILGAIVALFVVKRRRRRVQAANQKAQEDLAFLDEETNVFSFENSPTKSSARKRAYGIDTTYDGDDDGYSGSQSSFSQTSPSYGMISGIGSPTARSSLSGAETVKISNARLMPLPTKLTELASTSLFAFSEEDEDYEESTEGENSQRTSNSLQPSDVSNGSSFNRIMNDKSEEDPVSSHASSPQNQNASAGIATEAEQEETEAEKIGSPKSTIASFFSSHFFSTGDSVSHFNDSALTQPAANTTEAVKRKAAKQGVRSFSLSPRAAGAATSPVSVRSRAKSDTGGDDESADTDSVFDFISTSKKQRQKESNKAETQDGNAAVGNAPSEREPATPSTSNAAVSASSKAKDSVATTDATDSAVKTKQSVSSPTSSAAGTPSASAPGTPTGTGPSTPASSPSGIAAVTAALLGSVTDAKTTTATPPTVMKSNVTKKTIEGASAVSPNAKIASSNQSSEIKATSNTEEEGTGSLNPMRYLKKVGVLPRSQKPTQTVTNPQANLRHYTPESSQEQYDEDISEEDSLSAAPGSFPRRSRRHAKSTTHDGTFAYQTNAMQPQDWSMTDGFSDDDTLSEQGGGAVFGAFPKTGARSPKSAHKKVDRSGERSPTNQSRSSYSAVTQNSPASKTDSSQASASRQLINDLVWLSKKIAGVKQSAVDSAPGETVALGAPPQIETVDSLSYASQDGLISPTSGPGTHASAQRTPIETPTSAAASGGQGKGGNTSIVCRDCNAPPGKLNIVIHSTKDGPAVHEVKDGSSLEGRIFPGDLIIAVDDTDTRAFTAAQLMKMMAEKSQSARKITVLHFEEVEEETTEGTEE